MALAEDGELGFEEGMSWLPSQVLDEAFPDTTTNINNKVRSHALALCSAKTYSSLIH